MKLPLKKCQATGVSGSSGGTACTTTGAGGRCSFPSGKEGKVSMGMSLPGFWVGGCWIMPGLGYVVNIHG